MAVIGSLSVKLGLVTVEWDKATAKAKQDAKDLQTAFGKLGVDLTNLKQLFANLGGAAGLSVAGMAAMGAAILDMAGKMQDLADATGVSEGKILQFQKALIVAGGKAEDAQTIIGALFSKIAAAQDGNDTAIAQFEQLGITFEELKRSSPDEAIRRVYEGLSQLDNSFEKVRVTKELLGKAGLGKSVDDIAKALAGSTKEFDRQAAALKKWDEMGDAITQTMFNMKVAIAELLAPFTTGKVLTVEQFKAAIIGLTAAGVVSGIFNLVAAFKALNTALKGTAALSVAIGTLKGGKGLAAGAAAVAAYAGAMAAFGGEEESQTEPGKAGEGQPGGPEGEGDGMGGKEGGNAAVQQRARLELMRQQLDFAKRRNQLQIEYLNGNEYELKASESVLQKTQDVAQALSERNQALAKENLTAEQRGLIEDEYQLKVTKAGQEDEARQKMIFAQRLKALTLFRMESDQQKERSRLVQTMLEVEEHRRNFTEAEYQRTRAQLAMEQRLLDIKQQEQRYLEENKGQKGSAEYTAQLARFEQQATDAKKEFAAQVRIINKEESVRLQMMRTELEFAEKRNNLALQGAELEKNARYMGEFEYRRAQERIQLEQQLRDIEQQRENLRTQRQDTASEEYQNEVARLNEQERFARESARIRLEGIGLDEKEAKDWSAGWEKALREFQQNADNYGKAGEASFNAITSNMNSAIDTFVRTGKFAFKDFARSIIQDLIAIQMKAQAVFLLNAAFKSFGLPTLPGKAGGGAVSQNLPYMVGENGPELFVPQTGGTIVPNGRMNTEGAMGGQTINYNGPYIASMSAIDTQSAAQFLAKNRQSVWAANQSASRSLPQGR